MISLRSRSIFIILDFFLSEGLVLFFIKNVLYKFVFELKKREYFYEILGKMTIWMGKLGKENGSPLICSRKMSCLSLQEERRCNSLWKKLYLFSIINENSSKINNYFISSKFRPNIYK